ncbi:hypothetical protein [Mycolicibacterium chubuense]|nr:hypothetical protein [Mycolicibacterium chubuense]
MESTDLFSHRQAPQVVHRADSAEPVQLPTFSDSPQRASDSSTE